MATETTLNNLVINYLTQAQFDALTTKEANEIYLTPDSSITGVTAGSGLSGGGTSGSITLNHSNSITAKTTQAIYPITFDAQGHITGAGNAVTIPESTDVNVTQTEIGSINADYELLFSGTADNTTRTEGTNKSSYLTYNPSTHILNNNGQILTKQFDSSVGSSSLSSRIFHTTVGTAGLSSSRETGDDDYSSYIRVTNGKAELHSYSNYYDDEDDHYIVDITLTCKEQFLIEYSEQFNNNTPDTVKLSIDSSYFEVYRNNTLYIQAGYSGLTLRNLITPINNTDAATKKYVDDTVATKIEGSGTSGYLAKFNGTRSLTNGPQIGTGTTKFLREDGTWQVPSYIANTDENVKSTTVTAATTNYIVGSTTSTTTTGGLSKHASAILYTTADTATSGYTQLRLGNTTATTTAGGREGQIRLYGTTATYYVDLKAGAPSANRTITFPDKTGTIALTSDIPSYNDTNTTYTLTNALSSHKFTWTFTAGGSGSGSTTTTAELVAGTGITLTDDTTNKKITIASSVTNTDEKVKQTNTTTSSAYEILFSYTADNTERTEGARKTSTLTYNPSTKELVNGVAKLKSATSTTANTAAYDTLTLGNNVAVSSTTAHSQGQLILYGSTAYAHTLQGAPTAARTLTLPDKTGTIALTSDIPDVSGFITTDSDEKVATAAITSGTTYYPTVGTDTTSAATKYYDKTGIAYTGTNGTAGSNNGNALLTLGNSTPDSTSNWKQGTIRLYGTTAYYHDIKGYSGYPTANRTIYLPRYANTMYLTCVSTTSAVGGATTAPVYVKDTGEIAAVTSIPYSLLTGTPTIPTIPSNNVTGSGTNGYLAKWNGTYTVTNGPQLGSSTTTYLRNDGSWATPSDTKVSTAAVTKGTTYYPVLGSDTTAATTKYYDAIGLKYITQTISTITSSTLQIGNDGDNHYGALELFTPTSGASITIVPPGGTDDRTLTLPDNTGTIALISDIPVAAQIIRW